MALFIVPLILLVCTVALTRWVPRHPGWRPLVVILNVVVTGRYLWWRCTETLNWDGGWGTVISIAALAAEMYGFLVVLHHYAIAMRSVARTSVPPDAQFSPSVDIFVTSYNEDADILTRTLVGCQAIAYSNKRVYLLDDGRRAEIAALCNTLGVQYITRQDNKGAKAGNINNALRETTGEFVVTFDADHVPVSTFIAETLGYFRDSEVAQVQTAHHFFNPDLFQDRLRSERYIANEQDMFNHIVQPGRDVYNASFYCGSGAMFRRAALKQIGGLPMTSITEDLHTSMLLHSRGWRSVYVNKPLSAGLAPESFEAYITQRRRWSRGTMQVMFLRGGLALPGLTFAQRIHYFATLWYWLYGIPRVIYLVSPLFFLILGVRPLVVGDVRDLVTYYIPHLFLSVAAFQLLNRGLRRVFWSDIYESCIAVQIAIAALGFPFTGRRVHFAVTPKGQRAERRSTRPLWAVGWPVFLLTALMIIGIVKGTIALTMPGADVNSTAINLFWAAYNLVVLGFGGLLLRQVPQLRSAPRLLRSYACRLEWLDGSAEGVSMDLSETGMSVRLSSPAPLPPLLDVSIESPDGNDLTISCRLIRSEINGADVVAAVQFENRSLDAHRRIIELMFSSPDSWKVQEDIGMTWTEHVLRIAQSLREVFSSRIQRRRLAPRLACNIPVALRIGGGPHLAARAVDISHSGIRVRVGRDMQWREGVNVDITTHWNKFEASTFSADVVNVHEERGAYVLGLAFTGLDRRRQADLLKHVYSPEAARSDRRVAA